MQKLQRYVGYLLYFDANGYLRFYEYVPDNPGPFKKQFTLAGSFNGDRPNLDEMFAVARTRDLRGVRNDMTVIGIDPETWKPIVARAADSDSIYNIYAQNYLGYRSAMVWADNMFVSEDYAQQAVDSIFPLVRLPQDTMTLQGWLQPDLFPLDVIGAAEPYAAPELKPYWVTSINNRFQVDDRGMIMQQSPTCTINAQWLTPWG